MCVNNTHTANTASLPAKPGKKPLRFHLTQDRAKIVKLKNDVEREQLLSFLPASSSGGKSFQTVDCNFSCDDAVKVSKALLQRCDSGLKGREYERPVYQPYVPGESIVDSALDKCYLDYCVNPGLPNMGAVESTEVNRDALLLYLKKNQEFYV
ncbi:jg16431 [Pararge aegeria aegeria]|uniref:Jg16431 protein n=1 Tax=Pararge aegeria aegeria TaxID=348720 RepID=A0A8S4SIC1_9NEOP|nr:jg16431 [Pararge aegeria aegeria]